MQNENLVSRWMIIVLLTLGLCVACTSRIPIVSTPTKIETPESLLAIKSQSPDIRGTIIDLHNTNNQINGIYIEGILEEDTKYDKATVRLTTRTHVFRVNGDHYEVVTIQELKKGQVVEVIFVPGEIWERYPISAEAQEILIISQGN